MISFPRSLARRLRTVLRRSILEQEPRGAWPVLVCHGGPDGLTLEAQRDPLGLRCHLPGPQPTLTLAFRAAALADLKGRSDEAVTLEPDGGRVLARWTNAGVPRQHDLEAVLPETVPPLPPTPAQWTPMPDAFPQALADAAEVTAREAVRYQLHRVQLRAKKGQVVGTDGRQLLIRGGFRFPWADDVLVPRLPALGLRELRGETPVEIGRAGDHVVLRVGPWMFFLPIDPAGRFPDAASVVPRPSTVTCRVRVGEEDAVRLVRALPGLPGAGVEHAPVALDLGEGARVRAEDADGAPVTLELARSVVEGAAVQVRCNRQVQRRALLMGFRELHLGKAGQPAVWRDPHGVYVFVPLDPADRVTAAATAANGEAEEPRPVPSPSRPLPQPQGEPMSDQPIGQTNGEAPDRGGLEELIAESEALRRVLLKGAARAGRLAAALRQQRRQSKAVLSAMAALRQLQLDR